MQANRGAALAGGRHKNPVSAEHADQRRSVCRTACACRLKQESCMWRLYWQARHVTALRRQHAITVLHIILLCRAAGHMQAQAYKLSNRFVHLHAAALSSLSLADSSSSHYRCHSGVWRHVVTRQPCGAQNIHKSSKHTTARSACKSFSAPFSAGSGGRSKKSNAATSCTPSAFSCNTAAAKLERSSSGVASGANVA